MNKYSSIVLLLIILICFGCSNSKDKKTGKSPETITVEQVKDSLETDESLPTAQDLEQLDVVSNLVKNLRSFANSLERNVDKAKRNPSPENIQALLQHVYADEGELDTFISHVIGEAEHYGISINTEHADEDAEIVKLLASILK